DHAVDRLIPPRAQAELHVLVEDVPIETLGGGGAGGEESADAGDEGEHPDDVSVTADEDRGDDGGHVRQAVQRPENLRDRGCMHGEYVGEHEDEGDQFGRPRDLEHAAWTHSPTPVVDPGRQIMRTATMAHTTLKIPATMLRPPGIRASEGWAGSAASGSRARGRRVGRAPGRGSVAARDGR